VVTYDFLPQEDFDGIALNTSRWTFTNPLGDSTQSVSGGKLYLSVPAGTEHDLWTGVYTVPRIMRPVPNKDFTLQVKFDSAVTQRYQQQGLLVEQDGSNLIRAEVFHDGSSVKLFAATMASGTATSRIFKQITIGAPVYLRLARAGNQWTLSYSTNGTSWTTGGTFSQALAVTSAGVHVGNAGAAHTAVVDALSGTWAPDSVSVGSGTQHNASLTGLKPASNYRYRVTATDTAGNSATSADAQFATSP
jgi:regulation of enolase protein 1 (concanavalin A-like superfamily)